jgi:hypothetical protein
MGKFHTMTPRRCFGATSATNTGETLEIIPTPSPAIVLPAYISANVGPDAAVCNIPPKRINAPDRASSALRPMYLFKMGGIKVPKNAPALSKAIILDDAALYTAVDEVKLNSSLKLCRATTPPATPVSNPNRQLPIFLRLGSVHNHSL